MTRLSRFLPFIVLMSVLFSSASAIGQCYTRNWMDPEMVTPTTERKDDHPYRLIRTADDSLRVVWAEGDFAIGNHHLVWSAYLDPEWTTAQPLFGLDPTYRENWPHLSRGDDGTIALTYVRTPVGSSEGDLMLSLLYPDSLHWTAPMVIRSPVAYGINPAVVNVNSDSLWVFFNRGVKLRAKPVFHGVPGGEYIFDNLDGGSYAWTPEVLRTKNGTIWVFWSPLYPSPPLYRLQYITLSSGNFSAATYVPSSSSNYHVAAKEVGHNNIWLAYAGVEPVPPGDGAQVIKTTFWNGSTWGSEYWIAGGEGVKRNCGFGRFIVDNSDHLLLIYDCEDKDRIDWPWELYTTSWSGSKWCERERMNLPALQPYWSRGFQESELDEQGKPVVVYGEGPGPDYILYSTNLLTSVSVLQVQLDLHKLKDGKVEVAMLGYVSSPTYVLNIYGRGTGEDSWARVGSIAIEAGRDTYSIEGITTYGALRVDLYDLATGETVAVSNVLERSNSSSMEPVLWSRKADGSIQFCRNNAVTPKAMSGAIYDLAGRKVSDLRGFQAISNQCTEWAGVDSRGQSVSAGVYLVRFSSTDGGRTHTHVVRIVVRP